ncbi:MAG: DUF427 domain-containing protein [Magnetospirillum sp.]|nr:DUF427 domain-containing protein [Magnetospirillum sp.]
MKASPTRSPSISFRSATGHGVTVEPSPKHVRVVVNGKTVADTLCAGLMRESGRMPIYLFAPEDVRTDLLERSPHLTYCPHRGEVTWWTVQSGNRQVENAAWSYDDPPPDFAAVRDWLAFDWAKADHWFEEDEEIFGHPRDPHHRVDVRPSCRQVRVRFAGETIARTTRALFLFETGLPTRYYIPPADVRMDMLTPSASTTLCPYKGQASYWSLQVGPQSAEDVAWAYLDPLPECPRIKGHLAFYPEKVELLEVEGEEQPG